MAENPVNGTIARAELGKPGPPIGMTRYSAIKRAMGISGQRYVLVSEMRDFLLSHPGFDERDIYQRRTNIHRVTCELCGKQVSQRGDKLRWHVCVDTPRTDRKRWVNPGHVYILINAAMPGLLKIGMTEIDPETRAFEISKATGVPHPFMVAYSVYVGDCFIFERRIHQKLDKFRHSKNREFFVMPVRDAIATVNELEKIIGSHSSKHPGPVDLNEHKSDEQL